jgi:hypothetical protein
MDGEISINRDDLAVCKDQIDLLRPISNARARRGGCLVGLVTSRQEQANQGEAWEVPETDVCCLH